MKQVLRARPNFVSLSALSFAYFACVSEADISVPTPHSQVVLNGIIHPEQPIQVSVTRSVPLDAEQHFPPIKDAEVVVFENKQKLGSLAFEDSIYTIDYYPKEGRLYTIEVQALDGSIVRASDVIPYSVDAEACFMREEYAFSDIGVRTTIQDRLQERNVYWLNAVTRNFRHVRCWLVPEDTSCLSTDSSTIVSEQIYPLKSYSTLPDRFNSYVDNQFNNGITLYDFYMRIEDSATDSPDITLAFTGSSQLFRYNVLSDPAEGQSLVCNITSTSRHYDRYLKSSMIYYLNNEFGSDDPQPNPFAEPTRIYSNVENGLGIFAAYNSVSIAVEDFPCE